MSIDIQMRRYTSSLLPCVLSVLSCSLFDAPLPPVTNPYSPNYEGDYALSISWQSEQDTFSVLQPYHLEYFSTGRDTFAGYTLSSEPEGFIDTSAAAFSSSDSVATIYFLKPFTGEITLVGNHPNEKTTEAFLSVTVTNPFKLQGDTAAGIGNPDTIQVSGLTDTSLSVQWYLDGSLLSMDTGAMLVLKSDTVVAKTVFATITDTLGNTISTDTMAVSFAPRLPRVSFPSNTLDVPVGEETTISLQFSNCDSIQWIVKGLGVSQTNTGALKVTFTTVGSDTIIATGMEQDGTIGEPDTLYVTAIEFDYSLEVLTFPDMIQSGQWSTWQVRVTQDGSPVVGSRVSYEWTTTPDSVWDSAGSNSDGSQFLLFIGDTVASFILSVKARIATSDSAAIDDDSGKWAYISIVDTIIVTQGEPVVTGITPESTWIVDTTTYTVSASDLNGTVTSYFVKWENGGSYEQFSDSTVAHSYTTEGGKRLEIYVVDNDGNSSDTISDSVYVNLGKPTATPVMADSVWIYDNVDYKLRGTDPNGHVVQRAVSWATGLAFDVQTDSNFTHAYTTEGLKTTRSYVVDNDGISSDTVEHEIYVKLGEPTVASISLSVPLNSVYILDDIDFTVKGIDPNDGIDSIMISWDGDETYEVRRKAAGDSIKYENYQFARADSGANTVRVMVKDVDGLTRDSTLDISVLSGAPQIDSITPHSNIWVNDVTNYTIHAHDGNGTVDSFVVDWNNDGTWDLFSNSASMSWAFDTSQYGPRTVKIKVHDDDTVWTERSLSVAVRLGRPHIWASADTLYIPSTDGKVGIKLDSYDTNGTIVRYEWDRGNNASIEATTSEDSLYYDLVVANTAFEWAAYAIDNDSLTGTEVFWVYPDAPPPAPTFFDYDQQGDSTVFKWERKLDIHDGTETKVQIAYCFGTGCTPSDSLYASGSEPTLAEIESKWGTEDIGGGVIVNIIKADLPQSGPGRWRIILIDARGSKTAAPATDPSTFVAP